MTHFKKTLFIIAFTGIIFSLNSCQDPKEVIETISESDAAEMIASNFQENSGGMTTNINDISVEMVNAVDAGSLCNTPYSNTVSNSFSGDQVQAAYTATLSYELACNGLNVPQTASISTSTNATYTTPRIDSDDSGNFSANIAGLQPTAMNFTMNGDYSRIGTQELNFREQRNVNSTLTITLTDVVVNKISGIISSGSGDFSLVGTAATASFSFEGTIVFNGGKTATLTINGTSYDLDWN